MLRDLCRLLPANVAASNGKLRTLARTLIFAPLAELRRSRLFIRFTVSAFPGTANTLRISLPLSTIKVSRFSRGKESAVIRIA